MRRTILRLRLETTRKGTRPPKEPERYAPTGLGAGAEQQAPREVGPGKQFKVSGLCMRPLEEDPVQWGFLELEESESEDEEISDIHEENST